jgi:hypothetical protein
MRLPNWESARGEITLNELFTTPTSEITTILLFHRQTTVLLSLGF